MTGELKAQLAWAPLNKCSMLFSTTGFSKTWCSPRSLPLGRSKDRTSKQKQSIIQTDHFTAAFYKRSIYKKRFACIDLQIEVTHRDYCSSSSYPLIIENAQFISLTLEKS